MPRVLASLIAIFAALFPSALFADEASRPELPSSSEVSDHIELNWDFYSTKFARQLGTQGEGAEFLRVESHHCRPFASFLACEFVVSAILIDVSQAIASFSGDYERRPDGSLRGPLIFLFPHQKRKPGPPPMEPVELPEITLNPDQ